MSYKEERALENYPQALPRSTFKLFDKQIETNICKILCKIEGVSGKGFFVKYLFQIY